MPSSDAKSSFGCDATYQVSGASNLHTPPSQSLEKLEVCRETIFSKICVSSFYWCPKPLTTNLKNRIARTNDDPEKQKLPPRACSGASSGFPGSHFTHHHRTTHDHPIERTWNSCGVLYALTTPRWRHPPLSHRKWVVLRWSRSCGSPRKYLTAVRGTFVARENKIISSPYGSLP